MKQNKNITKAKINAQFALGEEQKESKRDY